jgi:oligosaccharyltransferase complex subunit delta (ribophorin II)
MVILCRNIGAGTERKRSRFQAYVNLGICKFNEHRFSANSPVDEVLDFAVGDTLRLAFTTKDGEKTTRPHQSFLLVQDPTTNLEVAIPVPVKPSGKAKLDIVCPLYPLLTQEHRDLPPQLLFADQLKLSLIIASFGDSTPLKSEVASIRPVIANDTEQPPPAERWGPKPEITHTFREPQKLPNKALSAIFNLGVLASLPIFVVLVCPLNLSVLT